MLLFTCDVLLECSNSISTGPETGESPCHKHLLHLTEFDQNLMMSNITNQCKDFRILRGFDTYMDNLRDAFGRDFNSSILEGCKDEICTTLYSTENSDISGIGVSLVR